MALYKRFMSKEKGNFENEENLSFFSFSFTNEARSGWLLPLFAFLFSPPPTVDPTTFFSTSLDEGK